ncbi:hypothetical protein GCM10027019_12140 [Melaminivora jejuensis]|uniref:hypothetical protein n=1 Tax=Melaminivora jejuensis TaxID=1267217 RepID=UPI001ADEEB09|nr:hypothetical protein [Melaminivora jejuensis]UHJ64954.1 hypothetical protein LVC68_16835 [Melaminivora jejuensis]
MLADPFVEEEQTSTQVPAAVAQLALPPLLPQLWHLRAPAGLCEATAVRALAHAGLLIQRRCWVAAAQAGDSPELLLVTAAAPDAQVQVALARLRRKTGADVQCQPCQPAPAAARRAAEI